MEAITRQTKLLNLFIVSKYLSLLPTQVSEWDDNFCAGYFAVSRSAKWRLELWKTYDCVARWFDASLWSAHHCSLVSCCFEAQGISKDGRFSKEEWETTRTNEEEEEEEEERKNLRAGNGKPYSEITCLKGLFYNHYKCDNRTEWREDSSPPTPTPWTLPAGKKKIESSVFIGKRRYGNFHRRQEKEISALQTWHAIN